MLHRGHLKHSTILLNFHSKPHQCFGVIRKRENWLNTVLRLRWQENVYKYLSRYPCNICPIGRGKLPTLGNRCLKMKVIAHTNFFFFGRTQAISVDFLITHRQFNHHLKSIPFIFSYRSASTYCRYLHSPFLREWLVYKNHSWYTCNACQIGRAKLPPECFRSRYLAIKEIPPTGNYSKANKW